VVVPVLVPPGTEKYLDLVVECPHGGGGVAGRATASAASRLTSADASTALARCETVSVVYGAINDANNGKGQQANKAITAHMGKISGQAAAANDSTGPGLRLLKLHEDVSGRIVKALSTKERFNRWGKHYLRALARSHQLQLCTNFMDPGLQVYGGTLFKERREEGGRIFLSLPPPQPTARAPMAPRNSLTGGTAYTTARAVVPDMSTYYAGSGGGCFVASATVEVVERGRMSVRRTRVDAVRAGDLVCVGDGSVARVRCVVRIHVGTTARPIVAFASGLAITAAHPVRVGGEWRRACDVPGAVAAPGSSPLVFNFVLDRCHLLRVDGFECATWGHCISGPIIGHPFYGTQSVVKVLEAARGWARGCVVARGAVRDAGGRVCGLIDETGQGHVLIPDGDVRTVPMVAGL